MKPKFANAEQLANYFHFVPKSDKDAKRLEKAWAMYVIDYKGDGCMGCVAEILSATTGSKKETVSNAGRTDCHFMFRTESGAIVPVTAERKTNGGRLKTLESEFSRAEEINGRFVVYSMDVCNAGTSYLRRHVDAVVIPRKLFIEKLNELGAIKAINKKGKLDGFGIQVSNKPFFEWLSDWPVVYDRNAVYSADDFDGLE